MKVSTSSPYGHTSSYLDKPVSNTSVVMALHASNASLHPPALSSPQNMYHRFRYCLNSTAGTFSITAFTITGILLLLPLYLLVLCLGYRRWRRQRSDATSHSNLLMYNIVVAELLSVSGCVLCCCGVHTDQPEMMRVGIYLLYVNLNVQLLCHVLTCVDRYLAVVHPVTYLGLRKEKGIRIRNVTICCVWLMSLLVIGYMAIPHTLVASLIYFCYTAFVIIVISFFSVSVLCVLLRPGPGGGGGARRQVDQSKLRAFYTIMAILGVLLVRFAGSIISSALFNSLVLKNERCGVWLSLVWFCLPSSLVSPLLFLHKAEKLPCRKKCSKSGQESG